MKRFILFLVLLFAASPAEAAIVAQPTLDNLLKTLVRYGALDLSNNQVLDEYAMVTDCDIYHAFSGNDFKWNAVRDSIRQSIDINISKFPSSYAYEGKLKLDHYDFQQQMFSFSADNPLQKVNAFFLLHAAGESCGHSIHHLPRAFRAVLDESVSLPGLPLTQRSADALLRRMDANNNKDRTVYVRFNLHINYVGKLQKIADDVGGDYSMQQQGAVDGITVMNAQIDTIDFFEDENHLKLLYSYQP